MKKYLLTLTSVTILCSPILFADTTPDGTTNQTQPIVASPQSITSQPTPSTPDTSTTPTSPATMPDTSTTDVTTPAQATTDSTTANTSVDVQLKTISGSIVPATIDSQNLQGVKVGDQLEVTSLGTDTSDDTNAATNNNITQ